MSSADDNERFHSRAYGMLQALLTEYVNDDLELPRPDESRGIVLKSSALDAIVQIFAAVDEEAQAGRFPPEKAYHVAGMLLILRDYIDPLPSPPGDEELLRDDLRRWNRLLKEARSAFDEERGE